MMTRGLRVTVVLAVNVPLSNQQSNSSSKRLLWQYSRQSLGMLSDA